MSKELYLEVIQRAQRKALCPPPNYTVSEWADAERRLSPEASAEPGKWKTSRTPYMQEIMDACNDRKTERIVCVLPSQVGKTELLLNVVGYFVCHDPSPILFLQPTLDMAQTLSKDRIAPMVRDTPALNGKIADPKSRSSGNTMLKKNFPGGHLTMCGANSPASLASRPIRIVLGDEIDRYPPSAGAEGDPVSLAAKRANTFWNRKIILTSTPTIKHASKIENEFENSTQERYCLECPECGEHQQIKRKHLRHIKNDNGDLVDILAVCESCGSESGEQGWKAGRSKWIGKNPNNGTRGFHMNCYGSTWNTWLECEKEFLIAKQTPETLQVFVNTRLAETWEEPGEKTDHEGLLKRREQYKAEVPNEALVLTAGVDVQNDRIEAEIVAWGAGFESWNVDYQVFQGDTSKDDVYEHLKDFLESKRYRHECGDDIRIVSACIDTGGGNTQRVYEFLQKNKGKRWWGVKGQGGEAIQLYRRSKAKVDRTNKEIPLYIVGVDEAKLWLKRRLDQLEIGPGYAHFPLDRDTEYFEQLTAEKLVIKRQKGIEVGRVWEKTRVRNEALDCRIYAYISAKILNPVFEVIRKNLIKEDAPDLPQEAPKSDDFGIKTLESSKKAKKSPSTKDENPEQTDLHIKTFSARRRKSGGRRRGSVATNW